MGSGPKRPSEAVATSAMPSSSTSTARPAAVAIFTGSVSSGGGVEGAAQVGEQVGGAGGRGGRAVEVEVGPLQRPADVAVGHPASRDGVAGGDGHDRPAEV